MFPWVYIYIAILQNLKNVLKYCFPSVHLLAIIYMYMCFFCLLTCDFFIHDYYHAFTIIFTILPYSFIMKVSNFCFVWHTVEYNRNDYTLKLSLSSPSGKTLTRWKGIRMHLLSYAENNNKTQILEIQMICLRSWESKPEFWDVIIFSVTFLSRCWTLKTVHD